MISGSNEAGDLSGILSCSLKALQANFSEMSWALRLTNPIGNRTGKTSDIRVKRRVVLMMIGGVVTDHVEYR